MIEPTFDEVRAAARVVAGRLPEPPEVVLAVGRGGLVVGVVVSHLLGPHRFVPVMARTTHSDEPHAPKAPPVIEPGPPLDLAGAAVLVIDDIVGSGRTSAAVAERAATAGARRVVVAAAYQNLDNWTEAVPPELIVANVVRGWVRFPWE